MSVKHDFFKIIDTEEKAYWLGFLYADGHVEKMTENSSRISILLKEEEASHLELLKDTLCLKNKVSVRKQFDKRTGKHYGKAGLRFTSKQMILDLEALGFTRKKKDRVLPPNIPKNKVKHFIRGYIDGDGWIRKDRGLIGFVCISPEINEYICSHIKSKCDVSIKTIDESSRYQQGIFNSNINKKKDSHKVISYLYKDAKVALSRKMIMAEKFMFS